MYSWRRYFDLSYGRLALNHRLNVLPARNTGKLKGLEGLKIMVFPDGPAGIVGGGRFWPERRRRDDGF